MAKRLEQTKAVLLHLSLNLVFIKESYDLDTTEFSYCSAKKVRKNVTDMKRKDLKAWFKRRILHAPNQIAELSACKMRRSKQLNSADLN